MKKTPLYLLLAGCVCIACAQPEAAPGRRADSARQAFLRSVDSMLLDTVLYELRAQIMVKVPQSNPDDESPLRDQPFQHDSAPGPHALGGRVYAEIGALRRLLGDNLPVRTVRERVFVGRPEVAMDGHFHGEALFVEVKLFARQYGAYTDITCTMATCAIIWPRSVMDHMRHLGAVGGTGMLEAHAEGIVRDIDVTKLPTG
jgi:hypothetical protein